MKKMQFFIQLFIMAVKVAIHRIIAVLDFPRHISDFINYAQAIHDSMSASSYFTSLAAKLTALQTAIDDLDAAETGLRTKPPTSTSADRDGKLNVAKGQLRVLRDNVQEIADADIENAETIIIAAGLKVKKIGSITRPDFAVKLTGLSGQVELVAKGNPDSRGAHEWGMRKIGDEWTSLPVTVHASTIISDLIPGDEMEFRHRAVLPEGKTDWQEETIRIM